MRAVDVVKLKRDELRNDLAKFMSAKNAKYPSPTRYNELNEYDKYEYSYILKSMENLRTQINALEFVLNEDTYMDDCTISYHKHRDLGITKESVFEIVENTYNRNFYS